MTHTKTKTPPTRPALRVFRPGEYLVTNYGEYSDRNVDPPCLVLVEFNTLEVLEVFKMAFKLRVCNEYDQDDDPTHHDFRKFLIDAKYIQELENVHDWHLGSYGDFDPL